MFTFYEEENRLLHFIATVPSLALKIWFQWREKSP